jgi:hypothetical protein
MRTRSMKGIPKAKPITTKRAYLDRKEGGTEEWTNERLRKWK